MTSYFYSHTYKLFERLLLNRIDKAVVDDTSDTS